MLLLKHIDSRLMVVDTEAEINIGELYTNGKTTAHYSKTALDLEGELFKILGEASIEQAIRLLQEKEALDTAYQMYSHIEPKELRDRSVLGFDAGVTLCLSTHPLTESEAKNYGPWLQDRLYDESNGVTFGIPSIDNWNRPYDKHFEDYKTHCFLSRLDGKEVEIQMERNGGVYGPPKQVPALESGKVVITKIKP